MPDSDLQALEDITDKLPASLGKGAIDVRGEFHWYRSLKDVYFLRKAPASAINEVSGTVSGVAGYTFSDGTDFDLIDDDGDGEEDSIDWSVGGDTPDDDTFFYVDYRAESILSRYVGAHDADVDDFEDDVDDTISGAQVGNATGQDLERIGELFGAIGKRDGRTDSQYRAFLKSIVQAFEGGGTKDGIEIAIATGIGVDQDQVTVVEDTDNTGYTIEIAESVDTSFLGSVINDMATIADPSGVKLLSPPIIEIDGDEISITKVLTSVTSSTTGLGSTTLGATTLG